MKKLSDKEQQLLLQIMRSCEYYHLNEKQYMKCINNILSSNISRRTYYLYKRKLHSHDIFSRLKESIYNSPLNRMSILLLNDDADPEVRAKVNKLIADQFPNMILSPLRPPYCADKNDRRNNLKDALSKIKKFNETANSPKNRPDSLPENATIREEFVKCGKHSCNLCPHGPYYYAYFKEKTNINNENKLRKKYVGPIDPRLP